MEVVEVHPGEPDGTSSSTSLLWNIGEFLKTNEIQVELNVIKK